MRLIAEEIIQALCWTLVHSLWQGLIAAVIAGIMIMCTKRSSAASRYYSLAILFLLFLAGSAYTFSQELRLSRSNRQIIHVQVSNISGVVNNLRLSSVQSASETNYASGMVGYLNQHATLVVAIWLFILSAKFLNLMNHARQIRRLKTYKTHLPSPYWQTTMDSLSRRLGVSKQVTLLESEIVKIPMVAGFLKPVILFPFALIMQLPPEQVEAVLLHELAHIKRKDHFINLLQSFAESFFFFNPGVLWISSLIRDERENCCDDIAIGETRNRKEFVEALVSFQEFNARSASTYTLAFPGTKNHLLNRVKRIVTHNNKTLDNMEKFLLVGCFIAAGLFTLAFSSSHSSYLHKTDKSKTKQANLSAVSQGLPQVTITDTIPSRREKAKEYMSFDGNSTTYSKNGYKIVTQDGRIHSLQINGKKIPDEKITAHQAEVDGIIGEIKTDMMNQSGQLDKQRDNLNLQHEELAELLEKNRAARHNNIDRSTFEELNRSGQEMQKMEKLEQIAKELESLRMSKLELLKEQELLSGTPDNDRKKLQRENANLRLRNLDLMILREELNLQHQQLKLNLFNMQPITLDEFPKMPIEPITLDELPKTPEMSMDVLRAIPANPIPPIPPIKESKEIKAILEELMAEKLISSVEDVSFTLNNEMLEVNGTRVSPELHAKLKEKFIKYPGDHIIYSRHGGSTHTEIHTDKP